MEQATRDEIGAAAAVHAELGREYEHAVAEGLVERIGAEIDSRIDARLGRPSRPLLGHRRGTFSALVMGLGSMGLGVGATAVVLSHSSHAWGSSAGVLMVFVIWGAIAYVNWIFANRK